MPKPAKKKEVVRLIHAAKEGDLAEIKAMGLKGKLEFVDRKDEQDWSALFWAVFNGHFEVVKYLVEVLSADVTQVDTQGRSALYLSCGWGGESGESGELTKFLIDNGADIHLLTTDGWSPLYLTAFRGKVNAARHLLGAGADLLQQDSKNRSPLAIAKATKHSQMIPILSEAAVTRMFTATKEGKSSILQTLIEEYNLDVNRKDGEGKTPLHVAMECGNEGAVKILISSGANDLAKDGNGRTPVEVAEQMGKRAVVTALQSAIVSREELRKSRIILEKERLMLLKQRKHSKECVVEPDVRKGKIERPEPEQSEKKRSLGNGIADFELTSYAVKILAKVSAGVVWRDIDQMMEELDIVDDIVVEEPDLSDLLNWSVWETDDASESQGESGTTTVDGDSRQLDAVEAVRRSHSSRRRGRRAISSIDSETDDEYDESGDEEEPAW